MGDDGRFSAADSNHVRGRFALETDFSTRNIIRLQKSRFKGEKADLIIFSQVEKMTMENS